MKTFFTVLLYIFIVLLIAGIVFGLSMVLGRPLEEAAIVLGVILGIWLLVILIKKLIIRHRAKAQVQRVLQKEDAIVDTELGQSPKQLLKSLSKDWNNAVKLLKKSHLRLRGDPLYVLPWYMVFGKPSSGKSTALRNAKLLIPATELSDHADGSTLNLEWWLYDQAIVIDTAGRYAVPDKDKRDRKEWGKLLDMLSRHKQKEPLNGVVLVITADRLLNCSEEELMEEGQQIRAGINELMEKLEAQMPVYLMVTKCDLVDQFSNWCQYLPEESLQQVMGYLSEDEVLDIDVALDKSFDSVLERIKELRLLMLERSDNPDDSLIELPVKLEQLRSGLHAFARTALKDNLYQETPKFRGLYFSSGQQVDGSDNTNLVNNGMFLHHLFTKVMPPDRGLLATLPSAERLRRAFRNYGISTSGAVLISLVLAITTAYFTDMKLLSDLVESHNEVNLTQTDISEQINAVNRLHEIVYEIEGAEDEMMVSWHGPFNQSPQYQALVELFTKSFQKQVLDALDQPLDLLSGVVSSETTAYLVSGIVRRINLIKAVLADDMESFDQLPDVPGEYLTAVHSDITQEASQLFIILYRKYVLLQASDVLLSEELLKLQSLLEKTISSSHGSFDWLIDWANLQGFPQVKIDDFWGGSRVLVDQPTIPAVYTLEGREFLIKFLSELSAAGQGSVGLLTIEDDFMRIYQRKYLKSWQYFTENFDIGKTKLRSRKEWLTSLEIMTGRDNPYFSLMRKIEREIEPVYSEGIFQAREKIEYFAEIQEFSGDQSGGKGDSKGKKKAAKMALKVIGKFGKVGKLVAKAGKKGMKTQKKIKKLKGKGGKQVDLDAVLEDAAKAYKEYKLALQDISFNADSSRLSYNATVNAFANPDTLYSGDDSGAKAWAGIIDLQRTIGKPRESSRLFWDLYTGPVRLAYDYMRQESSCHLQTTWQDSVLAGIVGVNEDKLGQTLIGENGLLWEYIDKNAAPFLKKKYQKGYVPNIVASRSLPWNEDFVRFVNNADEGRYIVANEFTVYIEALPTGINQSAQIAPYATYIDLHCADGVQTLANYNYSASKEFLWSLEKCGDATLRIEVGEFSLRKQYLGRKGFSKFLADFRDGRKIFSPDNFPEHASQLRNESVKAIDVNYKIKGQRPVIRMLTAVPLKPPREVISCWAV